MMSRRADLHQSAHSLAPRMRNFPFHEREYTWLAGCVDAKRRAPYRRVYRTEKKAALEDNSRVYRSIASASPTRNVYSSLLREIPEAPRGHASLLPFSRGIVEGERERAYLRSRASDICRDVAVKIIYALSLPLELLLVAVMESFAGRRSFFYSPYCWEKVERMCILVVDGWSIGNAGERSDECWRSEARMDWMFENRSFFSSGSLFISTLPTVLSIYIVCQI